MLPFPVPGDASFPQGLRHGNTAVAPPFQRACGNVRLRAGSPAQKPAPGRPRTAFQLSFLSARGSSLSTLWSGNVSRAHGPLQRDSPTADSIERSSVSEARAPSPARPTVTVEVLLEFSARTPLRSTDTRAVPLAACPRSFHDPPRVASLAVRRFAGAHSFPRAPSPARSRPRALRRVPSRHRIDQAASSDRGGRARARPRTQEGRRVVGGVLSVPPGEDALVQGRSAQGHVALLRRVQCGRRPVLVPDAPRQPRVP